MFIGSETNARQIPVTQARAELSDLVSRVAYSGERVVLTRHGKIAAALVSAEDLARLESRAGEHISLTSTERLDESGAAPAPPLRIAAEHRPAVRRADPPGFHG